MKKKYYLMLIGFFLVACDEESLTPLIETVYNPFVIVDQPGNAVQHKRYELYDTYGVPVFFNDTLSRVFVRIDGNGDSLFRYDRIDLNWKFTSTNLKTHRYEHTYLTTDEEKMKALELVEQYLKVASKPLRPYSVLVTKNTMKRNLSNQLDELANLDYEIGYRNLLLHNLEKLTDLVKVDAYLFELKKQMITNRLANFERELIPFYSVSDKDWYGVSWTGKLNVVWDLSPELRKFNASGVFTGIVRIELSAMRLTYKFYERDFPENSPESIEALRQLVRNKIGQFGFVYYSKLNSLDTYPKDQELDAFLLEILSTTKAVFAERWGASPLVMQKYKILVDIIKNELDVEL